MDHTSSTPVPRVTGWLLVALLAFWGVGAIGGGVFLARAPDGSAIGFDLSLLDGTPFPDFLLPGIILTGLGVAAVGLAGVLGHAIVRQRMTSRLRWLLLLTALGVVCWIVGEMAFLWSTVAALPEADRDFFYVFWAAYLPLSLAIAGLTLWVTRRPRPESPDETGSAGTRSAAPSSAGTGR